MEKEIKVTHYGNWILNEEKDIKIECYVMDNGERVLSLRGAARSVGLVGGGSQAIARNLNTQWIAAFFKWKTQRIGLKKLIEMS